MVESGLGNIIIKALRRVGFSDETTIEEHVAMNTGKNVFIESIEYRNNYVIYIYMFL